MPTACRERCDGGDLALLSDPAPPPPGILELELEQPLGEPPGRLGYQSKAAFSRAFKRILDTSRRGQA